MARVPVQQRLAFRERRQVMRLDQFLDRDRPQIGDHEVVAGLERFDHRQHRARARTGRASSMRPRNMISPDRDRARASAGVNSGSCTGSRFLQHDHFAADDIDAGARIALQRGAVRRRHCAARPRDRSGSAYSRGAARGRDQVETA